VNIPLLLQVPPFLLLGMVGTARVGRLPGRLIKGAGMILKIVFLLLLLASPCFAQQQMAMNVAVIGAGTAASSPSWVCAGSGTYTRETYPASNNLEGSNITCPTGGGTISKVRVIVTDNWSITGLKVAIYHDDGPPRTLHENTTIANPPNGNNDWTLSTNLVCTVGQTIKIAFETSGSCQINTSTAVGNGLYQSLAYADFPPANDGSFVGDDYDRAVCIYVTP
jgi:hypothetical protein